MKILSFTLKFLLLSFLTFHITSCSNENSDDPIADSSFDPIEITFVEGFFTACNQVNDVKRIKVSFTSISENENSCSLEIGSCAWNNNIFPNGFTSNNGSTEPALALFGGVFEIDLNGISGASKATITIDDNCGVGCTQANLYEGENVVANVGNTILGKDLEDLSLNLTDLSSRITIWSCEGAVIKIRIE